MAEPAESALIMVPAVVTPPMIPLLFFLHQDGLSRLQCGEECVP